MGNFLLSDFPPKNQFYDSNSIPWDFHTINMIYSPLLMYHYLIKTMLTLKCGF